jgi:4-alpha-glucanotransferase
MVNISVTAVSFDAGFYAGPPTIRTPHTKLSLSGVNGCHILIVEVDADDIEAVFAELRGDSNTWTELSTHDYPSVAELWAKERINEFSEVTIYRIGMTVNEWHGTPLPESAVMTRRDDLKPGDEFQSSHFGRVTVASVSSRGLTTSVQGAEKHQSESSDRDLLVPVYRKTV